MSFLENFDWKSLVKTVAPTIGTALGGPLGGVATSALSSALLGKSDGSESEIQTVLKSPSIDQLSDLAKADKEFALKLKELDVDLSKAQLQFKTEQETQATERHKTDMQSDSWLSKNARPLSLLGLLTCTMLFVFASPFFPRDSNSITESAFSLLTTLDMAFVTFYVGSRGLEKVQQIKARRTT